MTYILWIKEKGKPRVLALRDKFFASTGAVNYSTHEEFEKLVGRNAAKAALKRFQREQEKEEHPHAGTA
jgi:hypothetical protein